MPRFYLKFWIALLIFIMLISVVASFFGVSRPLNEGFDIASMAQEIAGTAGTTGKEKSVGPNKLSIGGSA